MWEYFLYEDNSATECDLELEEAQEYSIYEDNIASMCDLREGQQLANIYVDNNSPVREGQR